LPSSIGESRQSHQGPCLAGTRQKHDLGQVSSPGSFQCQRRSFTPFFVLDLILQRSTVMQHIRLHMRELSFDVSHMYQSTFSSDFTSPTHYFKQPLDNDRLPLLLASGVLGALILGRTMHASSAGAWNTSKLQYWSPGDGFVVHSL